MSGDFDWMDKAAGEGGTQRLRGEQIAKLAPTLWDNLARRIEAACLHYQRLNELPVEFSGRADHTVWVAVYEPALPSGHGAERERVTITFDETAHAIVVQSSLQDEPRVFPIDLDSGGKACLMQDGKPISIKQFIKSALEDAFFPGAR